MDDILMFDAMYINLKNIMLMNWAPLAHTFNPSYLEG
jgi:hypothetical protein